MDNLGTILTGRSDIIEPEREDGFTFPANSSREQLCIEHDDDNSSCEKKITGYIKLAMNSAVMVTDPHTATVIIQDNDGMTIVTIITTTTNCTFYSGKCQL